MANLGIIGYGIVGKAIDYSFQKHNKIIFYDKFKKQDYLDGVLKKGNKLEKVVMDSEFIFVSLPTPFSEKNGKIDLRIMNENIDNITRISDETDKIIVVKSTVVPGTTRDYACKYPKSNFCFNPEFLTEANYLNDAMNPDRIVIGADNNKIRLRVADLYKNSFPKTRMILTDTTTAEAVKYMANCFLATKVIFANEFFDLFNELGIKHEEVKKMVTADSRIYDSHLDVTSVRGFGGKCFPKDIVAIIAKFKELGVDCSLLEAVWHKNLKIRKHRDWEEIPGAKTEGKGF